MNKTDTLLGSQQMNKTDYIPARAEALGLVGDDKAGRKPVKERRGDKSIQDKEDFDSDKNMGTHEIVAFAILLHKAGNAAGCWSDTGR